MLLAPRIEIFARLLEFITRASSISFNFKIRASTTALALSLALGTSGFAPANVATTSAPSVQSIMDTMSQANAAVVGIRVTAVSA